MSGILGVSLLWLSVIVHCLSFFIGNSERFSEQASFSSLHFSTYPSGIFGGATRCPLHAHPGRLHQLDTVSVIRDFNPFSLTTMHYLTRRGPRSVQKY